MKPLLVLILLVTTNLSFSQTKTCENIFIITTDGFRWQEVFNGADSVLLFDPHYVKDTATLKYLYWADNADERRKKLLPFLWNYIVQKGQLWGNRNYDNDVSVVNPWRISYPGYNEIFTGYNDLFVPLNRAKDNPNNNVLEYLNNTPEYKNSVAAFGSWKLFDYIFNRPASTIKLNSGYQPEEDDSLTETEQATNYVEATSSENKNTTREDLLTFTLATEYIKKKHPRVVYIGFGETDEFAHHGRYDLYLNQANLFDKFLEELWSLIQSDDFYKNNTTMFITTDHGRGEAPERWATHGFWGERFKRNLAGSGWP
ncbi:MAG: alkaline phosphatase family protein [Ferruginibacter sp.]